MANRLEGDYSIQLSYVPKITVSQFYSIYQGKSIFFMAKSKLSVNNSSHHISHSIFHHIIYETMGDEKSNLI